MHESRNARTGFTLIELSIVMVIIALVIGGIVIGKELIEIARVRQQATQIEQYSSAMNAFKNKYNALPGDMLYSTAMQFNLPTVGGGSYRPNGNGSLDASGMEGIYNWTATQEQGFFWQQLSASRLIEGQYACVSWAQNCPDPNPINYPAPGNPIGATLPAMKFAPAYGIIPLTVAGNGLSGQFWVLGATGYYNYHVVSSVVSVPSLTPAQAFSLDSKMDDGVPNSGIVRIVKMPDGVRWPGGVYYTGFDNANDDNIAPPTAANCVNTGGVTYQITNTNVTCRPFIKMQ